MFGFLIYEPKKAFVVAKAIAWNMRNLRSSYASRLWVQSRRKVSERDILHRMYPALTRRQLTEHRGLRGILNILFEYSDRRLFQPDVWD
jgi:hypothetical protein